MDPQRTDWNFVHGYSRLDNGELKVALPSIWEVIINVEVAAKSLAEIRKYCFDELYEPSHGPLVQFTCIYTICPTIWWVTGSTGDPWGP